MNTKTYFVITIALLFSFYTSNSLCYGQDNKDFKRAEEIKYQQRDSAIFYYKKSITFFKKNKDTINMMKALLRLSSHYSHNVDYGNAYDGYWKALFLAEASENDFLKSQIYQELGWLYSFYSRTDEALKYFSLSLEIKKELKRKQEISDGFVLSDYFSLVNLYRINGDFKMANTYLDSCKIVQKLRGIPKNSFIDAEEGFLLAQKGNFDGAFKNLFDARNHFIEVNPSYLVIIDYLIGTVYTKQGNIKKSIDFYKSSLSFSNEYNSHSDYQLMGEEALSDAYFKLGDFQNAYMHSNLAFVLNEKIFGRNSKNNTHLFEIKDQFRVQKEKELQLIREQRIMNLENEKKVLNLRLALLIVGLASLLILAFVIVRNVRRKHNIEKQAIVEKRRIERQKANEILELKNKELTSSALQIIEKDEFIEKLKNSISGNNTVDVKTIHRMLKTIQGTPGSNWKQFEARFTTINQSFYKKIKDTYGNLGQTDLKICALIKLNFSSKEMSSLLGISIESVHTSRHRLRKKLKLERSQNLSEFIASL